MKEFRYIVYSIFLSSIIIYKDMVLATVVDVVGYGCACGCSGTGNGNVQSESDCSCHTHKIKQKPSDIPCSSVNWICLK